MRVRLLFLTLAASSIVLSAQTTPLRLVSTAWPPFTNPPGQPRFALDLVEAAFGRVDVKANTEFVPAAQFTTSLMTGKFDGSAAAWRDSSREQVLLFSQPYLENRLILIGRKGADVSAKSMGALRGKKIAIVEGYAYGDAVDASGATFVRSRTEEDSLRMLLDSKVDYTVMDDLVVQYIVNNYSTEAQKHLELGKTPLLTRQLYLAVQRSLPNAASIIDKFNKQLKAMITDGTYHKLLQVDWITADVDGDGVTEFVPRSSQAAGKSEPTKFYTLLSDETRPSPVPIGDSKRFYVGGSFYNAWKDVPESYKVSASGINDASRSTGAIFTFSWK